MSVKNIAHHERQINKLRDIRVSLESARFGITTFCQACDDSEIAEELECGTDGIYDMIDAVKETIERMESLLEEEE